MMEHTCQGMTLGDHSRAICTICGADLSKRTYSQLLEALNRVAMLHVATESGNCIACTIISNQEWKYPCPTMKAMGGENV
jgi:hypothetical protein